MTKSEVNEFLKNIKAYYNDFFYDSNTVKVWCEELDKFSKEDLYVRLREHLRGENRERIPLVQNLTRGLLTPDEKQKKEAEDYTVECNLCHRWMKNSEYEKHYDECMEINRLWLIGKKKDPNLKREQVESLDKDTLDKLSAKYPLKRMNVEDLFNVKRI